MRFVDGENFAFQAAKYAAGAGCALTEGPHYRPGVFAWMAGVPPTAALVTRIAATGKALPLQAVAIRATWYTSVQGSDTDRDRARRELWDLGFVPQVFRKPKGQRSKGVDITLTKDMLSHAFLDNYDVVELVAGDGDYVPLVEEVKRLGKVVRVAFVDGPWVSPELRLASDAFLDPGDFFLERWRGKPPEYGAP
jgi:hypothetical protein